MQTEKRTLSKREEDQQLRELFAADLRQYLASNSYLSVKSILQQMGNVVDESTLRRNLNKKNSPSAKTLRAFYAFKFKEQRDEVLIDLVPPEIKRVLIQHFSRMQTPWSSGNQSRKVDIQICNDLLFAELYSFTAFEEGTTLEAVQAEFGRRAVQKINEMIAAGVLVYNTNSRRIHPGKYRSTYSKESVQALAKATINNLAHNEGTCEGEAIGYIQFANLNNSALKQLVAMEQQHHRNILDIINNPQNHGSQKVVCTTFTDTFSKESTINLSEVDYVH